MSWAPLESNICTHSLIMTHVVMLHVSTQHDKPQSPTSTKEFVTMSNIMRKHFIYNEAMVLIWYDNHGYL